MPSARDDTEPLPRYSYTGDPLSARPEHRATLALAPDFTVYEHLSDPRAVYLELPRRAGSLIPHRLRVRLPLDLALTLSGIRPGRFAAYQRSDEELSAHVADILLAPSQQRPLPPPLAWEYALHFSPGTDPAEVQHWAMLRYLKAQRRRELQAITAASRHWIARDVRLDSEHDFAWSPGERERSPGQG